MSTQGTIKRYILIIEKINDSKYPSLENLREFLRDQGFEISERTLQRNIEAIRLEFNIDIKYDYNHKGYYIDKDSTDSLETFLKFLEIAGTAELISDSIKEDRKTLHYLSFDTAAYLKGVEYLKILLKAIKDSKVVTFNKVNYKSEKNSEYLVEPYLLKEYQNRWYLVGYVPKIKEVRTFGLDRIDQVQVLKEKFKKDKEIKPLEMFDNIIGVNGEDGKVEEVHLSLTPLQGKYLKSLPLHKSQQIIKEDQKETFISLKVVVNYELLQRILMLGYQCTVLQPKSLVEEVKNSLKESLGNY
jgi:predicted DNA-binding transcriptional regulator YafY